jgi:putative ABC transport system permease protein
MHPTASHEDPKRHEDHDGISLKRFFVSLRRLRGFVKSRSTRFDAVLSIAAEALGRYKLRTALSVLGVVFGVAAVIAMLSVAEGARREALSQVEALGLDNLIARSRGAARLGRSGDELTAGDADRLLALVPLARASSPLIERYLRLTRGERSTMAKVVGVRPGYRTILRLDVERGRFIGAIDEGAAARVCILGGSLARQLFGYRDPIGEHVRIGAHVFQVIGVLRDQRADPRLPGALAWRDVDTAAMVPLPALSGRTLAAAPGQPVDEIWLQVHDGARVNEIAKIFDRTLRHLHRGGLFDAVVPRELLAQRYRTQRTFAFVIGSVAAFALLVGGIGIMNIMLTSVLERTREIGLRRTVGATRRDVLLQFLVEALLMTSTGGALGVALGVAASWSITAYAGWNTHVSPAAVAVGVVVSILVGVIFGLYPAIKAARLEPVDAVRYE